jgi:hypothetical protein
MTVKRTRVVMCRPFGGVVYKCHFYGRGAARSGGRRLVCQRCGDNSSSDRNARNAAWMRARRRRTMAEGRCYRCGRQPLCSVDLCARCHSDRLERQRRRRAELTSEALCHICGRVCGRGHIGCTTCRADRRARDAAFVRRGVCPNCRLQNDRAGFKYCTACAAKRAADHRRAYAEGRIRVRSNPRGKQRLLTQGPPTKTPLSASVFLSPGSLARTLAAAETSRPASKEQA